MTFWTSPTFAFSTLDLRAVRVDKEETVVDVPFRDAGNLTRIANQTRPDNANAVWATMRFSHARRGSTGKRPVRYSTIKRPRQTYILTLCREHVESKRVAVVLKVCAFLRTPTDDEVVFQL